MKQLGFKAKPGSTASQIRKNRLELQQVVNQLAACANRPPSPRVLTWRDSWVRTVACRDESRSGTSCW